MRRIPRFRPLPYLLLFLLSGTLIAAACGGGKAPAEPVPPRGQPDVAEPGDDAQERPTPVDGGAAEAPATGERPPSVDDGDTGVAVSEDDDAAPDAAQPPPQPAEPVLRAIDWGTRRKELLTPVAEPSDLALLEEIGATVAASRGLELLREIPSFFVERSDLGAYFLSINDEAELAAFERSELIYQLLGILDAQQDLLDLFAQLYVGSVVGFYDWDPQAFFVVNAAGRIQRNDLPTIAHEFVHVLQDQHFNLAAAFDATLDNSDAALALRFIVEGDARSAERWLRETLDTLGAGLPEREASLPGAGAVPETLDRLFNSPYREGVAFVSTILATGDQAAIDALLADPPVSTEQLLHADKFAVREAPLTIDDPDVLDALGEGWTSFGSDTVGEMFLRLLLAEELPAAAANPAAAGWGGDRVTAYRATNGDALLVWNIHWDDFPNASEFFANFADWLERRSGGSAEPVGGALRYEWDAEARSVRLIGLPGETWIVVGTDRETVENVTSTVAS